MFLKRKNHKKIKVDEPMVSLPSSSSENTFDGTPANETELDILSKAVEGEFWAPKDWDCKLPTERSVANTVRAAFIHHIALGGDADNPTSKSGIRLMGAWITGELNFDYHTSERPISLKYCRFEQRLSCISTKVPSLILSHSFTPGFEGRNIQIENDLNLFSIQSTSCISIPGAKLGTLILSGNISNEYGVRFSPSEYFALDGTGIHVRGDVRLDGDARLDGDVGLNRDLRDNRGLNSEGEVYLSNSQINGDILFNNSRFSGNGRQPINAERMRVAGTIFFRNVEYDGLMSFAGSKASTFADNPASWLNGTCILDGLVYDRLIDFHDASQRIAWLNRQPSEHLFEQFQSQPWEQLIKVLRVMGHNRDAAKVAIAKQDQLWKAGHVKGAFSRAMHVVSKHTIGYGHKPEKLLHFTGWTWFLCMFFFSAGADFGYMGPTNSAIYNPGSPSIIAQSCGSRSEVNKEPWTNCAAMPPEYGDFNSWAYSLDVLLPLIDLGQEKNWAPMVKSTNGETLGFGVFLQWLMWFEILAGWLFSLIFVAVFSRLVEKD